MIKWSWRSWIESDNIPSYSVWWKFGRRLKRKEEFKLQWIDLCSATVYSMPHIKTCFAFTEVEETMGWFWSEKCQYPTKEPFNDSIIELYDLNHYMIKSAKSNLASNLSLSHFFWECHTLIFTQSHANPVSILALVLE